MTFYNFHFFTLSLYCYKYMGTLLHVVGVRMLGPEQHNSLSIYNKSVACRVTIYPGTEVLATILSYSRARGPTLAHNIYSQKWIHESLKYKLELLAEIVSHAVDQGQRRGEGTTYIVYTARQCGWAGTEDVISLAGRLQLFVMVEFRKSARACQGPVSFLHLSPYTPTNTPQGTPFTCVPYVLFIYMYDWTILGGPEYDSGFNFKMSFVEHKTWLTLLNYEYECGRSKQTNVCLIR